MNVIKSMMLDIRACKAYSKNFIIFFVLIAFFVFTTKSLTTVLMMSLFFLLAMWQYPFAAYDKCSALYLSLPQKKSDIVLGRYILAGSILAAAVIIGMILSVFIHQRGIGISGMFFILSAASVYIAVIISIQAPVFFRFGFMKSRIFAVITMVAFIPITMIVAMPAIISYMSNNDFKSIVSGKQLFEMNPLFSVGLLLAAGVVLLISYFISMALFVKYE
jgi:hypothetical protein